MKVLSPELPFPIIMCLWELYFGNRGKITFLAPLYFLVGSTSPSNQMTLSSFHNRSLLFSFDFVMLFTISSTSSSIKIAAIILRPQAGKALIAGSRQNQQSKHTVLEAKVHCCSRQNRASVNSNSDWLSAIFSNLTVAPAKIFLLNSIADVRSIAVISGPLLLGMSAFVSTDRTKVKIKKVVYQICILLRSTC